MNVYDTLTTLDAIFEKVKVNYFKEAIFKSSEMWGRRIGPDGKLAAAGSVQRVVAPGPDFYIPIKYAGEQGVSAISESDTDLAIPGAVAGKRATSEVAMKYIAGTTEITDIALKNLNTKAAIADFAAEKLQDIKDAIVAFYVRSFTFNRIKGTGTAGYGTGYIGTLYTTGGAVTITTSGNDVYILADGASDDDGSFAPGVWYLQVGMPIDIYDEAGTLQGTAYVKDISWDWDSSHKVQTVTLETASGSISLSTDTKYPIYMHNSKDKEPTSYGFIASDYGTLQGLSRSTYSWWKGFVSDVSTRSDYASSTGLQLSYLRWHLDRMRTTTIGSPRLRYAFTTTHQIRNLEEDLMTNYDYQPERIGPNDDLVYGGWGIVVDGVRVIYDRYVPPGRCFTPSYPSLFDYYVDEVTWRKVGGKIWYPLEGNFKYRAVLMMERQLATNFAQHQGQIIRLKGDFDDYESS